MNREINESFLESVRPSPPTLNYVVSDGSIFHLEKERTESFEYYSLLQCLQ